MKREATYTARIGWCLAWVRAVAGLDQSQEPRQPSDAPGAGRAVSVGAAPSCPRSDDSEGFSVMVISGLSRGFSTCCLRFKNGVATIHARLASGWLARLYREGVEPSGSQ